ncbi:unnamed protein product, partial [Urochloa humidicola]
FSKFQHEMDYDFAYQCFGSLAVPGDLK